MSNYKDAKTELICKMLEIAYNTDSLEELATEFVQLDDSDMWGLKQYLSKRMIHNFKTYVEVLVGICSDDSRYRFMRHL